MIRRIIAAFAALICAVCMLPGRCETMAKALYNGYELPALPEYDTETYPYAFIYYVGETPTLCTLVLVPADATVSYPDDSSAILINTSYYQSYSARSVDDAWEDDGITETSGSIYLIKPMDEFPTDYTVVQWTNFNIYTKDEELLLAASDPVPIPESGFDLRSWLTGLALGLSGKPLPLSTGKKLVGYSYNGTVLPALPEWDREMYPYAVIDNDGWYLACCTSMLQYNGSNIVYKEDCSTYCFKLDNGAWVYDGSASYNFDAGKTAVYGECIWTNTDILNEDGTLCLAASEPVPIYE